MKIAYFLPHPIQYQSPMIKHLVAAGFDMEVVYQSKAGAEKYFDAGFDRQLSWDTPLLEGYVFQVLPEATGFLHLVRLCKAALETTSAQVVWIHGWGDRLSRAVWLAARLSDLPVMLRGEASLSCVKGGLTRRLIHRLVFGLWFRSIHHFLAIGSANQQFYLDYGVPPEKISLAPYTVDNNFFSSQFRETESELTRLKQKWNIPANRPIVLFAGRLIPEKSVDLLLDAWEILTASSVLPEPPCLLIAGDGPMREALKKRAQCRLSAHVRFVGFLNQTELPAYYRLCDALVLPSGFEPWGVVVNEVMNAGKAVILSDVVGASRDLVLEGKNGWTFPSGNSRALAQRLEQLFCQPERPKAAGMLSQEIIASWNFDLICKGLSHALQKVAAPRSDLPRHLHGASGSSSSSSDATEGIVLAYSGFHEIPQMALAAYEMDRLQAYYCTLYRGPGTWGSNLARFRTIMTVEALGNELVPPHLVKENPWPVVVRQLSKGFLKRSQGSPLNTSRKFGRAAVRHLHKFNPGLVVGAESCAELLFEAAKSRGIRCMLDCHGIPVPFLEATMKAAATELGLPPPPPCESQAMSYSKRRERDLADIIVLCSSLQRDILVKLGEPQQKLRAVPLWVDTTIWHPSGQKSISHGPLKALFAGSGSLAKGLPYLLQAIASLGTDVELTIVGNIAENMRPFLKLPRRLPKVVPHVPKGRLREFYWSHDVLVMPSLGDSFGFVAFEAMACGLPVVATDHCGAPLPTPDWRVPARSATSIANRLSQYLDQREFLATDGQIASEFARQFPPSRYRTAIREIYGALLNRD